MFTGYRYGHMRKATEDSEDSHSSTSGSTYGTPTQEPDVYKMRKEEKRKLVEKLKTLEPQSFIEEPKVNSTLF